MSSQACELRGIKNLTWQVRSTTRLVGPSSSLVRPFHFRTGWDSELDGRAFIYSYFKTLRIYSRASIAFTVVITDDSIDVFVNIEATD